MIRFALLFLSAALAAAPAQALQLSSPDIRDSRPVPQAQIYRRCGGSNISPLLSWRGAPQGTQSFVLTMIDLDVRPSEWSHWVVVGLPGGTNSLPRGVTALPPGAKMIASNFGDAGYDGPCPPAGSGTHHYRLTLWALPGPAPEIKPDERASELTDRLERTALARASITGVVRR